MGLSNDTNLLEPVREGAIDVEAQVLDRGAGAWLWTVDARDESGRLAAHSRVTVAVRPLRA
jgi:acyl-coenzyme A thioesterase PaaI-like protein